MTRDSRAIAYMPWRVISALAILVIMALIIVVLVTSGNNSSSNKNGLQVVAAENFWGSIASQIGGKDAHVTSIITNPNADPHLYESDANDAEEVANANVVITNGVGYDDFMTKLLDASTNNNRQVVNAASILGVTNLGANPHLWYNIPKVHLVAAKIAASYETKDPKHKSYYQANLSKFDQSLQPLLASIQEIKQQYKGVPVAYTEPVPEYLLEAAGLDIKTPTNFAISIEDGNDPSPADTEAMDNLITNRSIRLLLYNQQTVSAVTQQVETMAKQAAIPVVGVTETMPANQPTYQSWQQAQLNEILAALKS